MHDVDSKMVAATSEGQRVTVSPASPLPKLQGPVPSPISLQRNGSFGPEPKPASVADPPPVPNAEIETGSLRYDENGGLVVYDSGARTVYADDGIGEKEKENEAARKEARFRARAGAAERKLQSRGKKRESALSPAELGEMKRDGMRPFPEYLPTVVITIPPRNDHTVKFYSRFESGNLLRATRVGPDEYNLLLRPDCPSQGCSQWFYFAACNVTKGMKSRRLYSLRRSNCPIQHTEHAQERVFLHVRHEAEHLLSETSRD